MFIIDYVFDKLGYVRKPAPWPFPPKKPAAKKVVKKATTRKPK
jgi:hypothetical protein